MFEDARAVEDGAMLECDLAVVGAGAAGIALALEFVDSPLRVCLLEAGGLEIDGATRSSTGARTSACPISISRSAACANFGGTTTTGPATAFRSTTTRSKSGHGSPTAAGR